MSSGPSGEFAFYIFLGGKCGNITILFYLSLNLLYPLLVDIFKTGGKHLLKKRNNNKVKTKNCREKKVINKKWQSSGIGETKGIFRIKYLPIAEM